MFYKLISYIVAGHCDYSNIYTVYVGVSGSTQSETMRLRNIQGENSPNWFTTVRSSKHVS